MSAGIRHDDLRRRNRAMVISAVRRAGQPSRTEIASATGLSHSTISAISADLIGEGILTETKGAGQAAARRGRPQVALELNPAAATVIVAVLTLNELSAAAIDYSGALVSEDRRQLTTATITRDELTSELTAMIRRLMSGRPSAQPRPLRVVLAIQGITDAAARVMLWSPITPHRDVPFADILEREFSIPATIQNDCNMMAIALRWRDPSRYLENFLAILLSHGIGMGLVLKGQLFSGTQSSGCEFGHMIHQPNGALCRCGRHGCVEAYAGDYAIWRNAVGMNEASLPEDGVSAADMQAVAVRARAGDGPEREAYRKAGTAIGYGIGSLFALIDPAPVAFVGAGAATFDLLEPSIRKAIAETAGGQHPDPIPFDIIPDELPLMREGCAMQALAFVDLEVFAAGPAPAEGGGKAVA
ncbi:ROK family protein [Mesorhizobium sp. ZMM04-5]|uniref:ROK family protein n=1 Tax=Mesorhizobium marinum TaxID=3228790 RepID=A0ABV3QZ38_9HYPH